jgi:hypothetical protein
MTVTREKPCATTRQDVRYPQLSELSMNYEGETEEIAVRPPDLSPNGMFVNTHKDLPQGAVLKLKFRLARTGVLVQVRCEVRYCLPGVGVGVQFIDISPEAFAAIKDEISEQVSNQ